MKITGVFKKKKNPKEKTTSEESEKIIVCKNCGTSFEGNFCPHCGQSTNDFNQPFRILIYDFMGTIFAFDTRFFKTLKTILIAPGKFSSDFVSGKRASYMEPFKFYVFISFVFFLLLNIKTGQFISDNSDHLDQAVAITSMAVDSVKAQFANDSTKQAIKNQFQWDNNKKTLGKLDKTEKDKIFATNNIKRIQASLIENYKNPKTSPFVKRILSHAIRLMDYPDMFVSKVLRYFSWSLFFLMPFFGFCLWVFFHKTQKYYYGHLIYSLASLSTTFIVLSVILALKLIFPGRMTAPENFLFWLIPVYIWLGLKRFYGRKALGTTFRMFILSNIYFVSTLIMVLLVFFLSLYF
ncbi:MAG: DUF3667 domain-containing protein [Bacteroidales bacterium]|nr:DUF3667 domain-containing protein [Bacteroidales bacterium]